MKEKFMNKMPNILKYYMNSDESEFIKFVPIKNKLPKNIFKTICAMLNNKGGFIFLGVSKNGYIFGIDKEKLFNIENNFFKLSKNLKPKIKIKIKKYIINNKIILCINVMNNFEMYQLNSKYYYRKNNKDIDISYNEKILSEIFVNKNMIKYKTL